MKTKLSEYSIKELEQEIAHRKTHPSPPPPKLFSKMDWSNLIHFVEVEINRLKTEGYVIKDFDHYIFEQVLETIYGKEIWDFWNNTARR